MRLYRAELVQGLQDLGVKPGMVLCVHSSLSAFDELDGGAQTLISVLVEILGPGGTIMMPTHPARDGQTFDPESIPSAMGIVSEIFRKMSGVIRSRHPYHPVAAWGKAATMLLDDHEKSPVPDGEETPYGRLIQLGGHVLLMGCDLDTMTLLHYVEAVLNLPYLRKLNMSFIDENGLEKELSMENVPGGHRGDVLKFNKIFNDNNAMQSGYIGNAKCRLISAPDAANLMYRAMSNDPAFVLDDNPNCEDCLRFTGMIYSEWLSTKQFSLNVRLPYHKDLNLDRFMRTVQSIGASGIEVDYNKDLKVDEAEEINKYSNIHGLRIPVMRAGPISQYRWATLCDLAQALNVEYLHFIPPSRQEMSESEFIETLNSFSNKSTKAGIKLLISNQHNSYLNLPTHLTRIRKSGNISGINLSYNPYEAMLRGIKPFYEGIYSGSLRRYAIHVDVCDGVPDRSENVPLGHGNCEIREILSNLSSRSYNGFLCLWPIPLLGSDGVLEAGKQFRQLIKMI